MKTKEELRQEMKKCLAKTQRPQISLKEFPQSTLLAYLPLKSEVDTLPLINWALEHNRTVAVPSQDPRFFAVLSEDWQNNLLTFPDKSLGVCSDTLLDIKSVEDALLLVPGLAFTTQGDRLGRGSGFYDRVLSLVSQKVKTAGVCRECQIVKELPTQAHDKKVSELIIS